jgi:hypothetical protein
MNRTLKFKYKTKVKNPDIIRRMRTSEGDVYNDIQIIGDFYRVMPVNAKEWWYLATLEHGVDKHAPAKGDGIIVLQSAIDLVSNHA